MDKCGPDLMGTCTKCGYDVHRVQSGRPDYAYEYYCSNSSCDHRRGVHVSESQEANRTNNLLWVNFGFMQPIQIIDELQDVNKLPKLIKRITEIRIGHRNFAELCKQLNIPLMNDGMGVVSRGTNVVVNTDDINSKYTAEVMLHVSIPEMVYRP